MKPLRLDFIVCLINVRDGVALTITDMLLSIISAMQSNKHDKYI